MSPTASRNVSALELKMGSERWLFDAGEGTQHQMIRSDSVRPTALSKIFITHLHGDHFFGLPGVMCSINKSQVDGEAPLEVIGPKGLRLALRQILKAASVSLTYRYTVHELHPREPSGGAARAAGTYSKQSSSNDCHNHEIAGLDVFANINGEWEDIPLSKRSVHTLRVHAGPLKHSFVLPCVGFVVQEQDFPGTMEPGDIRKELGRPENQPFLERQGIHMPLRALGYLKSGIPVQLHDRVVMPSDVLGPNKLGRKYVILGDTYDPSGIARLAANADIMVHEATNAFLPDFDDSDVGEQITYNSVLRKTLSHGHSTPEMAGAFAQAIGCKHLVLTHFSQRYRDRERTPDGGFKEDPDQEALLEAFRMLCQKEFTSGRVTLASDFMSVQLPMPVPYNPEEDDRLSPEEAFTNARISCASFLKLAADAPKGTESD